MVARLAPVGQRRGIGDLHGGADGALVFGQRDHRLDHEIDRHQIQAHPVITDVQQRQSSGPSAQVMDQVIDAIVFRGLARA